MERFYLQKGNVQSTIILNNFVPRTYCRGSDGNGYHIYPSLFQLYQSTILMIRLCRG